MKPHILCAVLRSLIVALAVSSIGPRASAGTVTFGNNSSSRVMNGPNGTPVTAVEGVQVALYYAPVGSSSFSQLGAAVDVGVPLPGLYAGGARSTGSATPSGATGQFQLRAWGGGFATFEQAAGAPGILIGVSGVIEVQMGNPQGDPPTPPPSLSFGSQELILTSPTFSPLDLVCGADQTVACGESWSFHSPTVTDGCYVNIDLRVVSTVTNGPCPEVITRMWQASDACGNIRTCSQTITVIRPECFGFSARISDSDVELSWASRENLFYQVQYCTDLAAGTWEDLGEPALGNGSINVLHDIPTPSARQRFYRLVWLNGQ